MMNILTKSFHCLTKSSTLKNLSIIALLCGVNATALAHTQWLKPSVFNTALGERAVWVTGQLAMAEYAFVTERAIKAKTTLVLSDGTRVEVTDVYETKTSSLFDFELTQAGTYKIDSLIGPRLRKARKPKDPTKEGRPASRSVNRLTSYITADAPSDTARKAEGTWLEIIPLTHPADLVEGEAASFKVLFEGRPLDKQAVTLIASGGQYQNQKTDKEYITDGEGVVTVELDQTGIYLIKSTYQVQLKDDAEAKVLRTNAGLTFEAQLN
jgi:uncharacterized GH25 family protein